MHVRFVYTYIICILITYRKCDRHTEPIWKFNDQRRRTKTTLFRVSGRKKKCTNRVKKKKRRTYPCAYIRRLLCIFYDNSVTRVSVGYWCTDIWLTFTTNNYERDDKSSRYRGTGHNSIWISTPLGSGIYFRDGISFRSGQRNYWLPDIWKVLQMHIITRTESINESTWHCIFVSVFCKCIFNTRENFHNNVCRCKPAVAIIILIIL